MALVMKPSLTSGWSSSGPARVGSKRNSSRLPKGHVLPSGQDTQMPPCA